jgi:hypothetical protein
MDIVFRTRNGQVLEDYWNKLVDVFGIEDIPLIVEAVAERRAFPSLQRGGRDTKKISRSLL